MIHPGATEYEHVRDLVPNSQRTACDQGDSTAKIMDFLFRSDYWLQDGLHCVCVSFCVGFFLSIELEQRNQIYIVVLGADSVVV